MEKSLIVSNEARQVAQANKNGLPLYQPILETGFLTESCNATSQAGPLRRRVGLHFRLLVVAAVGGPRRRVLPGS